MTLDPGRYECPEHHADLTGLVEEALGDDDLPPFAYRRPLLGRQAPAGRPFRVTVTCPGAGAAGPHSLTCTGTQAP
jgi:hypothetical protein